MPSTFAGLESARSGLTASQYGLDVTSQNVANAGTTGYSRQTLNMTSAGPYVGAYRTLPAGTLLGQGVNIGGTDQVRDEFLDTRYRSQNATYNEWKNLSDGLTSVEDVVNEFTSDGSGTIVGISGQLKDLVDDLQSYSNTPDDANLPTTVKSDFQTLCQSIRTAYSSLESLS
ncbi:MAG TPA: flagellar basal body protein, partial [Clostridia bacterium]|nr:flagellar basal body protein [Clostridia bacterium]